MGYSALTRRDRLERIATAERDRRKGRVDMAVATLGEPTEWPARAVLALARLPEGEGAATRQILESGLDVWAEELGLDPLSEQATPEMGEALSFDALDVPTLADVQDELDRPLEAFELDEAFAQAETQVEEMLDVNDVAERVLHDEPLGLAELSEEGESDVIGEPVYQEESLEGAEVLNWAEAPNRAEALTPAEALNRAEALTPAEALVSTAAAAHDVDAAEVPAGFFASAESAVTEERPSNAVVLATLESWLHNLTSDTRRRPSAPRGSAR